MSALEPGLCCACDCLTSRPCTSILARQWPYMQALRCSVHHPWGCQQRRRQASSQWLRNTRTHNPCCWDLHGRCWSQARARAALPLNRPWSALPLSQPCTRTWGPWPWKWTWTPFKLPRCRTRTSVGKHLRRWRLKGLYAWHGARTLHNFHRRLHHQRCCRHGWNQSLRKIQRWWAHRPGVRRWGTWRWKSWRRLE